MGASKTAQPTQAEKIGYVPRQQQATLKASGLTSAGMVRGKREDQELDEESAAGLAQVHATDAEIDAGITAISGTLDNIAVIATHMRTEVSCR